MSKPLLPSEKEVILWQDKSEKAVLKALDKHYQAALKSIEQRIAEMLARNDANLPHVIRRIEYQRMIKAQVKAAIDILHAQEYESIESYIRECYTDAFVGNVYTLHSQDIPVILPIDQTAVVKAVTIDSKLKSDLYTALGLDLTELKKTIAAEITRGIASGLLYSEMVRNIANASGVPRSRARTIVRTEGGRVQEQATYDAQIAAKAKGADVVSQWSAIRDAKTRPTHRMLDGQIREVGEYFEVEGKRAKHPHGFGRPEEDINCRCTLLTRARAAMDADELAILKERAKFFGLDKTEDFNEFKKKYLKAAEKTAEAPAIKFVPAKTIEEAEEYAQRFVPAKKAYKHGDISYAGLGLDNANTLNKVLTEVHARVDIPEKYGIPLVGNIQTMNFREKQWKNATEGGIAAAYNWGGSGTLFVNQKIFANPKTSASFFEKAKNTLQTVLDGADKLLQNTSYSASKRKYIEALVNTRVQTFAQSVNDPIEATFVHEMGHLLEERLLGSRFKEKGFDAKASMDAYGSQISGYAVTDRHEYIAESFTAFWYGREDIVDPELVAIFKESMR